MEIYLNAVGFIQAPGMGELVLILLIVLVLFGGSKIPEVARGLGNGIKEFKKAFSGLSSSEDQPPREIQDKKDE